MNIRVPALYFKQLDTNAMLPPCWASDWLPCVFSQVVVKTKADYDGESKKGKLRSPKIAEFSISIIEGVSERLKVRIIPRPSPLTVTPESRHPCSSLLCLGHLHPLCPMQGDIMHNDSFNPTLKLSLIQLLPWRWPPTSHLPWTPIPLAYICV